MSRLARVCSLIAIAIGLLANPASARQTLTLDDVVDLLEAGVSPGRVADVVTQYGISFSLDDAARTRLEAAGANAKVLSAVEHARREPPHSRKAPPRATAVPSTAPPRRARPTPTTRTATPRPTPTKATAIIVRSNVFGDEVRIDGREVGSSGPRLHAVAPGPHTVEIRTESDRGRRVVDVAPGETETVTFTLATPRASPTPTRAPRPTASLRVVEPPPPVESVREERRPPGNGPCTNLDECLVFADRRFRRKVCGGELTLTIRNTCARPITAKVCSQQTDGRARCQYADAGPKGTTSTKFCNSSGRYLWSARNPDNPGGACWPERLKNAAPVTAEIAAGGKCTILDHCLTFIGKRLQPAECGGKLTLEYRNTCNVPFKAIVCAKTHDGTSSCNLERTPPGDTYEHSFCNAAGTYKFAARSPDDWGESCWPVGFPDEDSLP